MNREVRQEIHIPARTRRFRPSRSDMSPKGRERRVAASMNAALIIPTSTVEAPRRRANSGTRGRRMYAPRYWTSVRPQATRSGAGIPARGDPGALIDGGLAKGVPRKVEL